eukprot:12156468-Karenia_brevis.AAC.1
MACTSTIEKAVVARVGQDVICPANWARNVGVDVSGRAGRRRNIASQRIAKAQNRSKKINRLRRTGARVERLVAAGVNAVGLWGSK